MKENVRVVFASFILPMAGFGSVALGGPASAVGDATHGAAVFQACRACHSTIPGEHMTGPSLAHMWHRKAGTVESFARYSDALKRSNIVWNEQTLDRWLADPQATIPGTSMTFAGLRETKDRHDVIAYLKAVSEGKAPAAAQGGGMMMGMKPQKRNLKSAPPEGQVVAISHCKDAYTVKTADGKSEKVWEFNLRFKTDSSEQGPASGKPVIVGAGMQGDRASVVFSAPSEISRFITESCS